ncbi:hypothetical protein HD597_009570 [Nonomuraea thailandensis]|uniref:Uncharacterized protein n=1 Tax=Nonomuraea thailandensis TaxID=1188745 RepID=A0A9X2GRA3_9ACTN|nr:hypothetical protein [Nonomuraea thailandensis]MCP2362550.1 hypothetical protein [Nonomuraea thailandensis]
MVTGRHQRLTSLDGLEGHPSSEEVRVHDCRALPPDLVGDLTARGPLIG